LDGYGVMGIF